MDITIFTGIRIAVIAFFAEYVDSAFGMGYGTLLTPLLILMGFSPLEVVPVVLLSEFLTGLSAGFTHHKAGNVNLKPKSTNIVFIVKKIKELGYIKSFNKGIPLHLKIALLLGICSVVGTIAAVFIAINLPKFWLKFYIGCMVFIVGVVILATLNKEYRFSWRRITFLGLLASFNKGLSGGGYGPLVTGGQILSGVEAKNAVGITSLSEAMTCFVGVSVYLITLQHLNWKLAPYIISGALLSVPLAAISVKMISAKKMKLFIGLFTIGLGIMTIIKTIFP